MGPATPFVSIPFLPFFHLANQNPRKYMGTHYWWTVELVWYSCCLVLELGGRGYWWFVVRRSVDKWVPATVSSREIRPKREARLIGLLLAQVGYRGWLHGGVWRFNDGSLRVCR